MNSNDDSNYEDKAKPFLKEIDFAFFAVNFGYSKADYEALTLKEKAFIYKAWENKLVSDISFIYNAVFIAVYNANRPKNRKALKLWRKSKTHKADSEIVQENIAICNETEKKEGDLWIKKVYEANNIKWPERK